MFWFPPILVVTSKHRNHTPLHDAIRDLLRRHLVNLEHVFQAAPEQPYQGMRSKKSDILVYVDGKPQIHLDISVVDAATQIDKRSGDKLGYIEGGGVQKTLTSHGLKRKEDAYKRALENDNLSNSPVLNGGQHTEEYGVKWRLSDLRPIIFDSTGTIHRDSKKWLVGFMGERKWTHFAHEASTVFAKYYGNTLRTMPHKWIAQPMAGSSAHYLDTGSAGQPYPNSNDGPSQHPHLIDAVDPAEGEDR